MQEHLEEFYVHYPKIKECLITSILTGSRVRGMHRDDSDFDIMVIVYDDWLDFRKPQHKIKEIEFKGNHFKVVTIHRYLELLTYNHFNYIESLFNQDVFKTRHYLDAFYSQALFYNQIKHEIETYRLNKRATQTKIQNSIRYLQSVYRQTNQNNGQLEAHYFQWGNQHDIESDDYIQVDLKNSKHTKHQLTMQHDIKQEWLKKQIEFNFSQIKT